MTFEEWWASEERDTDYFLPILAEAAWNAAVTVERERCAKLCDARAERTAVDDGDMMVWLAASRLIRGA